MLAAGLALAGCATAPEDASDAPMLYVCGVGKSFTASYALDGRIARVIVGGKTVTLRQVRSGSGATFAAGGTRLSTKGVDAVLDGAPGGPYRNCKTG